MANLPANSLDYNGSLIAASQAASGISDGDFNGQMIRLCQAITGKSLDADGCGAEVARMLGCTNWAAVGSELPSLVLDFTQGRTTLPDWVTCTTPSLSTAGLSVTAADNVAVALGLTWLSQTAGTLVVWATTSVNDGSFRRAASINDGGTTEEIWPGVASGQIRGFVIDGGAAQFSYNPGVAWNGLRKVAVAYEADNFAACVDGGAVTTDTSGTLPTTTRLEIGAIAASNLWNSTIQRVIYFPYRARSDVLQRLTA